MAAFKSAFSLTSRTENVSFSKNTVVNEESGYIWIDNRLKSGDVLTEVRVLPVYDETGEECEALAPDGSAASPASTLGAPFAIIELATIYKDGVHTFLSSVKGEDKNGDPVSGALTPVMRFMNRIGYKVYEQIARRNVGVPTDIPELWFQWREERQLSKPQQVYITRALALSINGEVKSSDNLGLFAIPKSAEEQFIQTLCTKLDPSQPLSLNNNELGDICSAAAGRTLRLKRFDTKNPAGERTKTSYALTLGRTMPLAPEVSKAAFKPWDEILNIMYIEDVIAKLHELYGGIAVDFAFRKTAMHKYVPANAQGSSDDIADAAGIGEVRKLQSGMASVTSAKITPKTQAVLEEVEDTSENLDASDLTATAAKSSTEDLRRALKEKLSKAVAK